MGEDGGWGSHFMSCKSVVQHVKNKHLFMFFIAVCVDPVVCNLKDVFFYRFGTHELEWLFTPTLSATIMVLNSFSTQNLTTFTIVIKNCHSIFSIYFLKLNFSNIFVQGLCCIKDAKSWNNKQNKNYISIFEQDRNLNTLEKIRTNQSKVSCIPRSMQQSTW